MQCPLKVKGDLPENSWKCTESDCAWWIGGENQECSVKSLEFQIRMINKYGYQK